MATSSEQKCCMCFAPSIRWEGAPICRSCFNAQAAERIAAKDRPAQVVTVGGVLDGAALLAKHGARLAAEGRIDPMGLGSIGRPAGTALH
jgi:hypothetical protein